MDPILKTPLSSLRKGMGLGSLCAQVSPNAGMATCGAGQGAWQIGGAWPPGGGICS